MAFDLKNLFNKYKQILSDKTTQGLAQFASKPGINKWATDFQARKEVAKKTATPFHPQSLRAGINSAKLLGITTPFHPESLQAGVRSADLLSRYTRELSQKPNKPGALDDIGRVAAGTTSKLLGVAKYPLQMSQTGSQNIATGVQEGDLGQVVKGTGQFLGGAGSLYYGGKLLGKGGLAGIIKRGAMGTGIGLGIGTGSQLLTGGGVPTKEQATEYAQSGLENSWTLSITNALTDKVLGKIAPTLGKVIGNRWVWASNTLK